MQNLKVAVIHVALLLASILYAVAGSLVFHSIEMPNERSVKGESVEKIKNFREHLVVSMWNNSQRSDLNETEWRTRSTKDISTLTDMLYIAFKKEFVKFRHVTMQINDSDANETDTDIWAKHSAFFFAITTMATIGEILGYLQRNYLHNNKRSHDTGGYPSTELSQRRICLCKLPAR